MATKLFKDIIVGPIISRRLGVSLGVNLLPLDGKLCNFDCIYCECGWTGQSHGVPLRYNSTEEVLSLLEKHLSKGKARGERLDVITFAGNGEPTMHPQFAKVIDVTVALRDRYYPEVKIAVLTNATLLGVPSVRGALEKVDRPILKIDSAFDETIALINGSRGRYALAEVIANMKKFRSDIIIQTMFLRGEYKGQAIDNTTDREVGAWLEVLRDLKPSLVMIYTLDRDTPLQTLTRVSDEELQAIGKRVEALGIACSVAKSKK